MTTNAQQVPVLELIPSDEETQIRAAVRGICESLGKDFQKKQWEKGEGLGALYEALGEKGYLALNVGEEWGGGGMGMSGLAIVMDEAAKSGNAPLLMIVSAGMAGPIIERHGTQEQKDRWLPGIVSGEGSIAFAVTEPDAGTNTHEIRTELRRDGDGFVLNGQKMWISGIPDARALQVITRMRREDGTLGKPTVCIVDTDSPGLTTEVIPVPYVGAEDQRMVWFDDVKVEPDRIIGGEEAGLAVVFDALNPERIGVASLAHGTAIRALDKAVAYANEREVWGTPIGSHQAVSHPLAKAKIEAELAWLMTQKAAALFDAGSPEAGEASNMAKYAAAEAVVHAVDAAIQSHGGNGISLEYGVSDMWWGARLFRIAPVSAEMILNHVAQHSLGLPRSY